MSGVVTHVVLLNARSGTRRRDAARDIRREFEARGIRASVREFDDGADIAAAARRAVADGAQVVAAGGGDGTVSAVAGALVGSNAALGVLPLGTLNHFAKDMGVPLDLGEAIDAICGGRLRRIDVGRVNGRVFVNNASLGLYSRVIRYRERLTEGLGHSKWLAFAWAAWTVLRRHPFLQVRLTVAGEAVACRTPLVFIGNNSYELDGLHLGARQCLDAGHLSVHVVAGSGRRGILMLALRALLGRLRGAPDFATFCAPHVEVQTKRRHIMVATDGEVSSMETPLVFTIEPRALAVMTPAGED